MLICVLHIEIEDICQEYSQGSITCRRSCQDFLNIIIKDFPKITIMDLRPKSKFLLVLDSALQEEMLHKVFDCINGYITSEIHKYLTRPWWKAFTLNLLMFLQYQAFTSFLVHHKLKLRFV